jgi:hypothetical protein
MATDPVGTRERSLQRQLAGYSAAVSPEEARRGLDEARADLESGRGKDYGLGFGFIRQLDDRNDRLLSCFAVTSGEREANVHVLVTETTAATVANEGEEVRAWTRDRLYDHAGRIARNEDRYLTLLRSKHPLRLG